MNRITKTLLAGAAGYGAYVASAYLRYGRPRRAAEPDTLLDRFMPAYDVCERHRLHVEAPPAATLAAAKEMNFDDSRIVRAIFRGRELLLGSERQPAPEAKGLFAWAREIGWGVLADTEHELVMGGVTKPWQPNPTFTPLPPDEFAAFAEPDHVKIVWTLRADPDGDGGSVFRTETRAVATDGAARRKFRLYWSFLSPGIILVRAAMLPPLRAAADHHWRLEGDDLLPDAAGQLTHATTIEAPPRDIWPWLVQMGCQRAGWYSWDVLDNGRVPSADHIIPELQHLKVGDVLPARPVGTEGFEVRRIVPERALVLGSLTPEWKGTWAFVLEPLDATRTRLVTRYRADVAPTKKMALMLPVYAAVHAFMERKQLRTLKLRAEQLYAREPAPSWADAT